MAESKNFPGDPVTLFRNGESRSVYPIDADSWRALGWGDDPDTKVSKDKISKLESGVPDASKQEPAA